MIKFSPENKTLGLKGIVEYGDNPEKTIDKSTGQNLVFTYCCESESIVDDFKSIKDLHNKNSGTQYFHFIQSFHPDDVVSAVKVHELGVEFATSQFEDFQFAVYTHTNEKHLHNHIIVNSVSMENGKKVHFDLKSDYEQFKQSDKSNRFGEYHYTQMNVDNNKILEREGLTPTPIERNESKEHNKGVKDRVKNSGRPLYVEDIRNAIDIAKETSYNLEEMLEKLSVDNSITIKSPETLDTSTTLRFYHPDYKKNAFGKRSLGEDYSKQALLDYFNNKSKERIEIERDIKTEVLEISTTAHKEYAHDMFMASMTLIKYQNREVEEKDVKEVVVNRVNEAFDTSYSIDELFSKNGIENIETDADTLAENLNHLGVPETHVLKIIDDLFQEEYSQIDKQFNDYIKALETAQKEGVLHYDAIDQEYQFNYDNVKAVQTIIENNIVTDLDFDIIKSVNSRPLDDYIVFKSVEKHLESVKDISGFEREDKRKFLDDIIKNDSVKMSSLYNQRHKARVNELADYGYLKIENDHVSLTEKGKREHNRVKDSLLFNHTKTDINTVYKAIYKSGKKKNQVNINEVYKDKTETKTEQLKQLIEDLKDKHLIVEDQDRLTVTNDGLREMLYVNDERRKAFDERIEHLGRLHIISKTDNGLIGIGRNARLALESSKKTDVDTELKRLVLDIDQRNGKVKIDKIQDELRVNKSWSKSNTSKGKEIKQRYNEKATSNFIQKAKKDKSKDQIHSIVDSFNKMVGDSKVDFKNLWDRDDEERKKKTKNKSNSLGAFVNSVSGRLTWGGTQKKGQKAFKNKAKTIGR